ncbi:MAG: hypothetical protein IKP87_13255, partial [Victivallales bacterium]|nr:hypothetical protein [Victivallales bacterium]
QEKADLPILKDLQRKADMFFPQKGNAWYMLFSKNGFTEAVLEEAAKDAHVLLVDIQELVG